MGTVSKIVNKWLETEKKYVIITAIVSAIILVIAIVLLSQPDIFIESRLDYTECRDDSGLEQRCDNFLKQHETPVCTCYATISLEDRIPEPVTVYYNLPDYDQTSSEYASSKDDAQLAGNLSPTISKNCGNYSYEITPEGKKPIAPCGEIADSMFQDQFILRINYTTDVPTLQDGFASIERYKNEYRNPHGDLQAAFKDFAKPKSWLMNVTSLDKANADNNGFQNERFIGWMNTGISLKPALRINHIGVYKDGLPEGNYTMRIRYYRSNYISGRRIVLLRSSQTIMNSYHIIGILLTVISILGLLLLCYWVYNKYKYSVPSNRERSDVDPSKSNGSNRAFLSRSS